DYYCCSYTIGRTLIF
nr:immunoglobulin light chain junction region [Macaca mulatta]MOW60556.1 immunoglobulin light chain junction region [Macaca mulatta]